MDDCNCPYCGAEIEINHDDGYGYCEDETYQQECHACGKTFVYTTDISYSYSPEKADCLNEGGKHDWKPIPTYPKCMTRMRCSMCNEEREPTNEEIAEHGIPSRKEYFDSPKSDKPKEDR